MKYVVDTSVWSLALRRSDSTAKNSLELKKLNTLLEKGERIFLTGLIFQEVLQGIKQQSQFQKVHDGLIFFPFLEETKEDFFTAARLFNYCRSKGVQTGTIDALIASICIRNECLLLTHDKDFEHIAHHSALKLL